MRRQLWLRRRRHQRITGYRLGMLPLWHVEGDPRCHHCTYIAGTTSPEMRRRYMAYRMTQAGAKS